MLKEIADGVFVEDAFEGGNVGVVITQRGGLLIDTPMLPPDARQWQLTLLQLGVEETYGVVNTDYHPEHFLGNAYFMPARVFGHENSFKPIAKYQSSVLEQLANSYREKNPVLADEILHIEICPPEISVGDRVTLHLGERRIEVLYMEGHTPSSLGVYLPEERILFGGDNITCNDHPVMSQANSREWLRTLERIREMDVDMIVPGVGEICDKSAIEPLHEYISDMREQVTELFQRGSSRREAVEKVSLQDYFPIPEDRASRIKRIRRENIERVYTEVRTASRKR
ncbi:MAG TPA: MBL fold metallo-hydrolase [Chloroflexi bacterium]|nr:MBL fold metallo-hydrolase [Chloroflexota bacterium]